MLWSSKLPNFKKVFAWLTFFIVRTYSLLISWCDLVAQQINVNGANTCRRTCRETTSIFFWHQNSLLVSAFTSSSGQCMLRISSQ